MNVESGTKQTKRLIQETSMCNIYKQETFGSLDDSNLVYESPKTIKTHVENMERRFTVMKEETIRTQVGIYELECKLEDHVKLTEQLKSQLAEKQLEIEGKRKLICDKDIILQETMDDLERVNRELEERERDGKRNKLGKITRENADTELIYRDVGIQTYLPSRITGRGCIPSTEHNGLIELKSAAATNADFSFFSQHEVSPAGIDGPSSISRNIRMSTQLNNLVTPPQWKTNDWMDGSGITIDTPHNKFTNNFDEYLTYFNKLNEEMGIVDAENVRCKEEIKSLDELVKTKDKEIFEFRDRIDEHMAQNEKDYLIIQKLKNEVDRFKRLNQESAGLLTVKSEECSQYFGKLTEALNRIETLESLRDELKEKHKSEINELNGQLDKRIKEKRDTDDQLGLALQDIAGIHKQLDSNMHEICKLRTEKVNVETQNRKIFTENNELNSIVSELRDKEVINCSNLKTLRAQISEMTRETAGLRKGIDILNSESSQTIATLNTEIEGLHTNLTSLKERLKDKTAETNKLKVDLDDGAMELEKRNNEKDALQEQNILLKLEKESFQTRCNELSATKESLAVELDQVKAHCSDLHATVLAKDNKLNNLIKAGHESTNKINLLKREIFNMNESFAEQQMQYKGQVTGLQKDLAKSHETLAENNKIWRNAGHKTQSIVRKYLQSNDLFLSTFVGNTLGSLRTQGDKIFMLTDVISQLKQKYQRVLESLTDKDVHVSNIEHELKLNFQEMEALIQSKRALESKNDEYQQSEKSLKRIISKYEADLDCLKDRYEISQKILQKLNDSFDESQSTIQFLQAQNVQDREISSQNIQKMDQNLRGLRYEMDTIVEERDELKMNQEISLAENKQLNTTLQCKIIEFEKLNQLYKETTEKLRGVEIDYNSSKLNFTLLPPILEKFKCNIDEMNIEKNLAKDIVSFIKTEQTNTCNLVRRVLTSITEENCALNSQLHNLNENLTETINNYECKLQLLNSDILTVKTNLKTTETENDKEINKLHEEIINLKAKLTCCEDNEAQSTKIPVNHNLQTKKIQSQAWTLNFDKTPIRPNKKSSTDFDDNYKYLKLKTENIITKEIPQIDKIKNPSPKTNRLITTYSTNPDPSHPKNKVLTEEQPFIDDESFVARRTSARLKSLKAKRIDYHRLKTHELNAFFREHRPRLPISSNDSSSIQNEPIKPASNSFMTIPQNSVLRNGTTIALSNASDDDGPCSFGSKISIISAHHHPKLSITDDKDIEAALKQRINELNRRNTLSKPHLKSTYPIEIQVVGDSPLFEGSSNTRTPQSKQSKNLTNSSKNHKYRFSKYLTPSKFMPSVKKSFGTRNMFTQSTNKENQTPKRKK